MKSQKPIIFFDGICPLCNGFVDQVVRKDHKFQFLFAPLQGETAKENLPFLDPSHLETIVLLESERKYERADAILRILTRLGGFYKMFIIGYLLPSFARDALYSWVARHRYSWFGQLDSCRLPTPNETMRFLP
ncbi:MAG: thiol-disulfide oxidoreductase DCC family protein [Pseudobdellovibrionaceae bacterium]